VQRDKAKRHHVALLQAQVLRLEQRVRELEAAPGAVPELGAEVQVWRFATQLACCLLRTGATPPPGTAPMCTCGSQAPGSTYTHAHTWRGASEPTAWAPGLVCLDIAPERFGGRLGPVPRGPMLVRYARAHVRGLCVAGGIFSGDNAMGSRAGAWRCARFAAGLWLRSPAGPLGLRDSALHPR
jgi:hypothetical protein